MSLLSPRLQLKVAQKQILTPGLVQMVTVLQLNRLELKEMITQEIVKNPVLEESTEEPGEEITPEELLPLLEAEAGGRPRRQANAGSCRAERRQSLAGSRGRCGRSTGTFSRMPRRPRRPRPSRRSTGRPIRAGDRRPPPIRSTRSISARSSTTIWIPGTRARRRSRSKSRRSRRFFRRR